MSIDFALLGQYVHELSIAPSLEARFLVYENQVSQLGFDGVTYAFAPSIQYEIMPDLPVIFLHSSSYPIAFLEHYRREHLDRYDFTIRKILSGDTSPLDWREHELSGELSEEEVKLIRLARETYGIQNALSIPTLLDERGAAGASIISYQHDTAFQSLKETHLAFLVIMTRLFHDINFSDANWPLYFILPVYESLSEKELKILKYKSSGKPMKKIYNELAISKSYADNVFSRMKKRLGNVNTERLMYLFGLLNGLDNDSSNAKRE